MVYWREPLLIWLMLFPLVVLVISSFREKKRQAQLVDVELLPWIQPPSRIKRGIRRAGLNPLLLSTIWVLLTLALAGPRTPQFIPNDLKAAHDRVVILLDYSDSMRAIDAFGPQGVVPRVTAATQLADSWFNSDEPIVETGLLAFSGRAHWLLKPTTDSNLVQHVLSQGEEHLLPTLGSNLVDALSAIQFLPRESDTNTHIVLLTDGDVAAEKQESLESALLTLHASMPITLSLIGLGSAEPSQVPGHPLANTSMNSSFLKQLASLNQDFSYRLPDELREEPLMVWLNIESRRITPENYARVVWHEWFALPLLLALLLLSVLLQPSRGGHAHD